jgi:hypothetical protein
MLAVVVLLSSCSDDLLNLQPHSSIGDNGFYNNANEVEGAVIAIYDGLQAVPLREFAITEMRSDNSRTKTSEGDWAQFESFQVEPTNQVVSSYWKANYNVIFRANRVLENLDVVTDGRRNQFEGEALFARALAHFNLVRAYGGVPIVDKVIIQTDTDYFDRDTEAAVLAAIDADLTNAATLLPSRAEIAEGRATQGAAQALLAKVKLTTGDYSGAEALLNGLLSNADYALMDDYNDVFYNEMNSEIIFAIPYINDDANESQDFSFEMTVGGVVSGLNFGTDDLIASIDPADTERQGVIFNLNSSFTEETGKFLTSSSDVRLCGNDWIVLRLADVYLMHVEAIMGGTESTQSLTAIGSFNAVRARAGMPELATDGSATITKEMLSNERRVELAFENHRFYDLVRMGMAETTLSAFAVSEGYIFTPTDLLLPIPQDEINVSSGLLIQNPGYN